MLHALLRRAATCHQFSGRLALAAQPSRISGLLSISCKFQQFVTTPVLSGRGPAGFVQQNRNATSLRDMSPNEILASVVNGTSSTPPALAAALSQFVKKRGNTSDPRLNLLVEKLAAAAPRLKPIHIASVLVACTRITKQGQFADSGSISSLLQALCNASVQKINDFKAQGISSTVWAMATLGHSDTKVLGALLSAAEQKAGSFTEQEIANTLWGMACLNVDHQPAVQSLWTRVLSTEVSDCSDAELTQLFGVVSWFKLEKTDWGMLINPSLESAAVAASSRSHGLVKSSQFHNQVSTALSKMGVVHHNEKDIGGQLVDIAIDQDSVVLEVDGPHHYCRNNRLIMLGNYRLKQRLLEAQGWRVVHIPFYEWNDVQGEQRAVYLEDKLKLP